MLDNGNDISVSTLPVLRNMDQDDRIKNWKKSSTVCLFDTVSIDRFFVDSLLLVYIEGSFMGSSLLDLVFSTISLKEI